jgi:hypothetical protein
MATKKPKAKAKKSAGELAKSMLATKGEKPKAKKPKAKKPKGLEAAHVLTVNSVADGTGLPTGEHAQFVAAVKGIVGLSKGGLKKAVAKLDEETMGLHKLSLSRAGKPVWDVWINTVMDDGAVFPAGSAEPSGIGISQTRVYDMEEDREELCAEIYTGLYESGFRPPLTDEWSS